MPAYEYTIHAKRKLQLPEIKKLGIGKKIIQQVILRPNAIDNSEMPVLIAIGYLTDELSLCVVYRKVRGVIRIITFYPAEKGRCESKILSER